MSNKTDKISEKTQTIEKTQPNQSLSTHSFLKTLDNKKKDPQVQKVDNQPLEPAAIQANATKTPSMISKETIVNLDIEPEKELGKKIKQKERSKLRKKKQKEKKRN